MCNNWDDLDQKIMDPSETVHGKEKGGNACREAGWQK